MEKSLKKERHKSNEKHSSTNKKTESLESCLEKMKKRLERHFKKEISTRFIGTRRVLSRRRVPREFQQIRAEQIGLFRSAIQKDMQK